MSRLARIVYWTVPSLFCLALYWPGFRAWFQQDDFAWLSLNQHLNDPGGIWALLFTPRAQGTFRPLSERAFFMVLHGLFGLNATPFRVAVFATQFANLALLASIAWRLTGWRMAGLLAPLLWVVNGNLAVAMSWTSAYNQVLCAFFILASFRFLLSYLDTGRKRFLAGQWVCFLLGFGALEINVVYPAIAMAYVLAMAPKHWRTAAWLFVPSAAYTAVHWHYAPKATAGPYAMHWTSSMIGTLWTYWGYALGPERLPHAFRLPAPWLGVAGTVLLTAAVAGLVVVQWRRRDRVGAFLAAWFVILLAPVLPLRDHISDYYLTMPVIGVAMLGAWALAVAWRGGWRFRLAAAAAVALYAGASFPMARVVTDWNYRYSLSIKNLILGLVRARELNPGKAILLTDVSSGDFWGAIYHKAHWVAGVQDVYLVPGSEKAIEAHPELDSVAEYEVPPSVAVRALEEDRAVVYSAAGGPLRNVTRVFRATARTKWGGAGLPFRVDAGNPLFAAQLGPTWYPAEGIYRWMPKRATVWLHGPVDAGQRLYLTGFCAAASVREKPLPVSVSVDGELVGRTLLTQPDAAFALEYPLPAPAVGKPRIEVAVEVGHTFHPPGDARALGLVFGTISVR